MGRTVKKCKECGEKKRIIGRGLCSTCYSRARRAGAFEDQAPNDDAQTQDPQTDDVETDAAVDADPDREVVQVIEVAFYKRDLKFLRSIETRANRERRAVGDQLFMMALDRDVMETGGLE